VAFCEIDKKAQQVLRKHWPNVPIFEDVCTLTKELLDERGITIDVICGGFPCQDISLAGKGAGIEGERSGLWTEYARIISELRPKFVIVENVSALLSRGLDRVLGDLAEIGYDAEWHCIPASAVGAPHRRDRVWIIAYPEAKSQRPDPNCIRSYREEINQQRGSELRDEQISIFGSLGEKVAYPNPDSKHRGSKPQFSDDREREEIYDEPCWVRPEISYTMREGLERQRTLSSRIGSELSDTRNNSWWATEPNVGRVAHGVSGRVDRLKQLGNAVVPQIPELIGRAIYDLQNQKLAPIPALQRSQATLDQAIS
jgi:DNA (cytosine-5)-methyltransferase 1